MMNLHESGQSEEGCKANLLGCVTYLFIWDKSHVSFAIPFRRSSQHPDFGYKNTNNNTRNICIA